MKEVLPIPGRLDVEGDVALILIALFCLAASSGIALYVGWYVHRCSSARKWLCIDADLIELNTSDEKYGSGIPKTKIRYAYTFNGTAHEGVSWQLGLHRDRPYNAGILEELRHAYASDRKIRIYVNPSHPSISSTNIDFDKGGIAVLASIALLSLIPVFLASQ